MAYVQLKQNEWARLSATVLAALQSVAPDSAEAHLLRSLQAKLEHARITDQSRPDRVSIGTHVVARNVKDNEPLEFVLVMPEDADWSEGRVSVLAPMAAAFLGRKVGEHVLVHAPTGNATWVIESVSAESPAFH